VKSPHKPTDANHFAGNPFKPHLCSQELQELMCRFPFPLKTLGFNQCDELGSSNFQRLTLEMSTFSSPVRSPWFHGCPLDAPSPDGQWVKALSLAEFPLLLGGSW